MFVAAKFDVKGRGKINQLRPPEGGRYNGKAKSVEAKNPPFRNRRVGHPLEVI